MRLYHTEKPLCGGFEKILLATDDNHLAGPCVMPGDKTVIEIIKATSDSWEFNNGLYQTA